MHGNDTPGPRADLFTFATADAASATEGEAGVEDDARAEQLEVLRSVLSIASAGGYESLSMSVILKTSGVPRRAFNAWFSTPEDAFVAALDRCMEQLLCAVREAIGSGGAPEGQLREGLRAAVDYLVADPARADALVLEVHGAGHRALHRQEATVDALVGEARTVLGRTGLDDAVARRVARLGVGALREAIRTRMARGELHTLPTVVRDLADAAFPLRSLGPQATRSSPALTA